MLAREHDCVHSIWKQLVGQTWYDKLLWLAADSLMVSLCMSVRYSLFDVWFTACVLAFLHIRFVCIVWLVDGNPVPSSFAIPTCLHCDWAVSNHLMWFVLVKQPMFLWWGPPPWCVLGVFDAGSLRALKSTLSRSRCPIKQWQAFFSDRYTCTHSYTHFRPDKYWFCWRSL